MGRASAAFVAALVGAVVLLATAAPAFSQPVRTAAPVTIDGPSSDIVGLSGFSIARDGSGGVVYLKRVMGIPHVFVSRLIGGVFQTPAQLDAAFVGASSQPVIAAGNGGLLLVAYTNGGQLYAVDRLSSASAASAPIPLASGGVTDPSIAISNFGKAYVSFTVGGAGGHDVRAAYFAFGNWALEPTALDAQPAADAGTGSGRSQVAVAGDGVAIVSWGEAGHVYTRRVWATAPSTVFEQADVPSLGTATEVSADLPSLGSGGDSSYVTVAFHEVFRRGVQQQSRVLMRRLHGSLFEALAAPDGLATPGTSGAVAPDVTVSEYGRGFVTAARDDTNQLYAMTLASNDAPGPVARVDSLPNSSPPAAVPALAGLFSNLIAWQEDPGGPGVPEIRARYAGDGSTLGGETVLSSRDAGPTDAARGLAAAGDVSGNAAVSWVQGSGASSRIVAALMYVPPGSAAPNPAFQYSRSSQPLLSWSPAREHWGPVQYTLSLDGTALATTTATSVRPPVPLPDGEHTWLVTAANPVGQQSVSASATVWVDMVAPVARLSLGGRKRAGSELHAYVSYTDSPPPEPREAASGVADVLINWGDGSSFHVAHGKFHAYRRAGRYTLTVLVTDRAGNATRLAQSLRIAPKPKPKPKKKHRPGKRSPKRRSHR